MSEHKVIHRRKAESLVPQPVSSVMQAPAPTTSAPPTPGPVAATPTVDQQPEPLPGEQLAGHEFGRIAILQSGGAAGIGSLPGPPGGGVPQDDGDGAPGRATGAIEAATRSIGQPLSPELQQRFAESLGADLSGVRIHTSGASAEAAEAVTARAYTLGQDIHFRPGQYDPSTPAGQRLLAHEVAHTMQQPRVHGLTDPRHLAIGQAADPLETEAERAAPAIVEGRPARLSRSVGAAPMIQRQPAVAKTGLASLVTPRATARNWGAQVRAQSGMMDYTWAEGPAFTAEAQGAAKVDSTVGAGVSKFAGDWASLQVTWNTVGPLSVAYREAAKNAAAEGVTGPASAYNPEGVIRTPGDPSADLAGAVEKGKVIGTKSDVKIGDVFDGSTLKPAISKTKLDRGDALDEKVNALLGDVQREIEDALDGLSNEHLEYKNKVLEIKKALTTLTIKTTEKESAGDEAAKVQIEREKAIVIGGIEATAGIFKMGESYLTARASGAGGPKKDPGDPRGKAVGGSGVVDTASGVVTYFVGQSYDQDLHAINLRLESAKQFIATHNKELAQNDLEIAINNCKKQENTIREAKRKLVGADQKRRNAIKEVAKAASASAASAGASKAEQERIEVAIRALPALELVVSRIRSITSKITLPQYTPESGLGAAFATNVQEFIEHYGILLGAADEFSSALPTWEGRLTEVNNLIKNLHSSAVP